MRTIHAARASPKPKSPTIETKMDVLSTLLSPPSLLACASPSPMVSALDSADDDATVADDGDSGGGNAGGGGNGGTAGGCGGGESGGGTGGLLRASTIEGSSTDATGMLS